MDSVETILNESEIIPPQSNSVISEEPSDIYSKSQLSIFAPKDDSNSIAQDFNSFLFSSRANSVGIDEQEMINQSAYYYESQVDECTRQIQQCDSVIVSEEEGRNEEGQQQYIDGQDKFNCTQDLQHLKNSQMQQSRLTIPLFDCYYQQTCRSHSRNSLHFLLAAISDPIRYHHIQNIKESYLNETNNSNNVTSLQALWSISPFLLASRIANYEFSSMQISKLLVLRSLQHNGYEIFRQFGTSLGYLISEKHKHNSINMLMNKNNHKRDQNGNDKRENRINTAAAACSAVNYTNEIRWPFKTNEQEEEEYDEEQEKTARFQYLSSLNSSASSSCRQLFQSRDSPPPQHCLLNEINQSTDSQSSLRYSSEPFSFSDQKMQFFSSHPDNNCNITSGIITQPFLVSILTLGSIIRSLQILSSHMYLPYLVESTPDLALLVHLSILAEPLRQLLHLEWQQQHQQQQQQHNLQNFPNLFPSFIADSLMLFFKQAYPISKSSQTIFPISQATHFEQLIDSLLDYTYFPKRDFPSDIRFIIKNELFS